VKNLYAACLSRLGLSQTEAAALHGVRLDTVKSWSGGRNQVPNGAWQNLRDYEAAIVDRSEAIREEWEDAGEIRDIDITLSSDDPQNLMALADFLLTTNEQPPIAMSIQRAARRER
jgi:hypothetical protein